MGTVTKQRKTDVICLQAVGFGLTYSKFSDAYVIPCADAINDGLPDIGFKINGTIFRLPQSAWISAVSNCLNECFQAFCMGVHTQGDSKMHVDMQNCCESGIMHWQHSLHKSHGWCCCSSCSSSSISAEHGPVGFESSCASFYLSSFTCALTSVQCTGMQLDLTSETNPHFQLCESTLMPDDTLTDDIGLGLPFFREWFTAFTIDPSTLLGVRKLDAHRLE